MPPNRPPKPIPLPKKRYCLIAEFKVLTVIDLESGPHLDELLELYRQEGVAEISNVDLQLLSEEDINTIPLTYFENIPRTYINVENK